MRRIIIAASMALALSGSSLLWAAAGQPAATPDPKVGTRITITGCLHEGTVHDSYVLLGVTERPAGSPPPGPPVPWAIYWLDSTRGLKAHLGEMVDITGKVTERKKKLGTITVAIDPTETRSTDVRVESGTDTVNTEKFNDRPRPAGTPAAPPTLEVSRPVYVLKVESIRTIKVPGASAPCR